jgi:hypothetical protein
MKIREQRHIHCRLSIADCGEAVPALRPAGIPSATFRAGLPAAGNKGKMPSPRHKSQIANRKLRNGFVLILVITAIAVIGIEMFALATVANTMQFQSHTAYLQACRRNLTASGMAWAKQNIPNKAGESAPQAIKLDVGEMNIRGSGLDLTVSSVSPSAAGSDRRVEVLIKTSCSRGRQTLRGESKYKISL